MTDSILEPRRIGAGFAEGIREGMPANIGAGQARATPNRAMVASARQAAAEMPRAAPDGPGPGHRVALRARSNAREIEARPCRPAPTGGRHALMRHGMGRVEPGGVPASDGTAGLGSDPRLQPSRPRAVTGTAGHCGVHHRQEG